MRTGLPWQLQIWSDVVLAALNIGLRKSLRLSLGSVGASAVGGQRAVLCCGLTGKYVLVGVLGGG